METKRCDCGHEELIRVLKRVVWAIDQRDWVLILDAQKDIRDTLPDE